MTIKDSKNQDPTIIDELETIAEQTIDDTDNIGTDIPVIDLSEQLTILQ
jgi:hypothetical protein